MDCPTCGLTNPPEALRCDCGYDFSARKSADLPGWQISLDLPQKVAAFWSISWPAGLMLVVSVYALGYFLDLEHVPRWAVILATRATFFMTQAVLTHRLVGKNYRSFRVYVVRQDGKQGRRLSLPEAFSVWLWIAAPQLLFATVVWLMTAISGTKLPHAIVQSFSYFASWVWLVIIGPYGVGLAIRRKYPAFRLEARGLRYV